MARTGGARVSAALERFAASGRTGRSARSTSDDAAVDGGLPGVVQDAGQVLLPLVDSLAQHSPHNIVPRPSALLSVVEMKRGPHETHAAPNTPQRGDRAAQRPGITAGQTACDSQLIRIRRLGVRIPSGALIAAGQDHFSGGKPLACSDQMISYSG